MCWEDKEADVDFDRFNDDDSREDDWRNGVHTDKEDKVYQISEMTDSHLRNTINHFVRLDTSPLQKELDKR